MEIEGAQWSGIYTKLSYFNKFTGGTKKSEVLRVATVRVTNISSCSYNYRQEKSVHIDESVICAGNTARNRADACGVSIDFYENRVSVMEEELYRSVFRILCVLRICIC